MVSNKVLGALFVGLCLIAVNQGPALAGDYPDKPITLIIPLGAGGSHDLNARVFSSIIHEYLGQPIVVKLMPGAGGQRGTAAAVRAKPDGYTLLFTHNYLDQLQPQVEKLPYDTTKELVTVCRLNYSASFQIVMADKPWKNLEEVLDYARKNPGKLRVAHSGKWGAGFTPLAILFSKAKVDVRFLGYRGGGPAFQAQLAGEADYGQASAITCISYIQEGKIRPIVGLGKERRPDFPNLPTLGELGYTDDVMHRIIMAPRKTPPERVQVLRDAFRKLGKDKTFIRMMQKLGENTAYMDGPEYEKLRLTQKQEYLEVIKEITGQK